ncbi:cytochrome c oxidase subunit VB-domain-containing protein [Aspergillus alliaceus]|uniref:Cytochrome c oxidase subunit 4, mitochondrial n=1 Tax=Petromyces alliaceus TaxID=209559 RepID=A0A5N7CCL6_PETAA|nr:cytochrome c oxidase subunit VB-domain-containing protein [Aspergillus alliaceus]
MGAQVVYPDIRSSSATNQPALLTIRPTTGRSGFKLTSDLQTPSVPKRPHLSPPPLSHQFTRTMFLQRTAFALARRTPVRAIAARPFSSSVIRSNKAKYGVEKEGKILSFEATDYTIEATLRRRSLLSSTSYFTLYTSTNDADRFFSTTEIKTEEDLVPPGAKPGSVPSDIEQATGLERLELVGKMQGIDIFDMRPLDASRKGTLENPIIVNGAGDEQYAGCTGYPADSHVVNWLTVSRERPIERCGECGNVVKLNYIGPEEDPHAHDHGHGHGHPAPEEPKTFADYVKPEYWYR